MQIKTIILVIFLTTLLVVTLRAGTVVVTNDMNYTGTIKQNGSNLLVSGTTTYAPYIIPFATSNNIALTNGDYQYYAPTNTSTIYLPTIVTNETYSLRIDLQVGTNSFTIATNGFSPVILSTNPVFSVSTSAVTPVIFDKAYNSSNWYSWTMNP